MNKPVPALPCQNCGRVIWRQGSWFQCSDCGCLSTAYGGHFANIGEDGKELGVEPEFKAAVDAVRCNFALRYKESIWLMREPDGAFATTSSESEHTFFCLFDSEKLLRELGEGWEIYNNEQEEIMSHQLDFGLTAGLVLRLELFSNEELAALRLALNDGGKVKKENFAFGRAVLLSLIKEDGTPQELEELEEACSFEINRRKECGAWN